MKGFPIGFLAAVLATLTAVPSFSAAICVLTYERQNNHMTKAVLDVYQNYPKALVVTEALPLDFVNCIEQGASEIVIIAHAIEIKNPKQIRLGYMMRRPELDKSNRPTYRIGFFLDHVFKVANEVLKSQETNGQKALTKIRIMACDPKDVFQAYPSFRKLLSEHSIELDTAPKSPILSFFHGASITGFNKAWLAKDISCGEMTSSWRTNQNSWCESDSWPGCNREEALYCLPPKAIN